MAPVRPAILLVLAAACGVACGNHSDAPPPPAARPASITDADAAVFDKLIPKLEQLAATVARADHDCARAALAIQWAAEDTAALIAAAAKIDERTKTDPAAAAWAAASYAPRVTAPITQITSGPCASDAKYLAAVRSLLPAR